MLSRSIIRCSRFSPLVSVQKASETTAKKTIIGVHSLIHETHEEIEDGYRVPKVQTAQVQPRQFRECDNDILYVMSINGDYGARKERLIRDIMRVDHISWPEARDKVDGEINSANDSFSWLVRFPYQVGVVSGFVASVTAVPLVFHRDTAEWFNEKFVFEDVPDGGIETLDSFWKVGNWTWGWMEPYLGTASFVLLGLQFTRINMQRLHWKPYTERILAWRAERLVKKYPQYNEDIVRDFSEADPWD
mmetsp:Transcript_26539/g.45439  ORF Transcript_26539/g.45439 Transcript_26539/m.45439 type:complete len:247 (+) Transcript_26539:69-809(+)